MNGGESQESQPDLTSASQIDTLIRKIESGELSLSSEATTNDIVCTGSDVMRIIAAHPESDDDDWISWSGIATSPVGIPKRQRTSATLSITGSMPQLSVYGHAQQISVLDGGKIGKLEVFGPIGGLAVIGSVGSLFVWDDEQNPHMNGRIDGDLHFFSTTVESIFLNGAVSGNVELLGSDVGHLSVTGEVEGTISLLGKASTVFLKPICPNGEKTVPLVKFGMEISSQAVIGSSVNLAYCDLRQCADFDKLRFFGSRPFQLDPPERTGIGRLLPRERRQALAFTAPPDREGKVSDCNTPFSERAVIYRQLRAALEKSSNRPAASDFYFWETENRRLDARHEGRVVEAAVLTGYKWLSAYGTRVYLPMIGLVAVTVISAVLFAVNGINLNPDEMSDGALHKDGILAGEWNWSERIELVLFTARSVVAFFSPPSAQLSSGEGFLQLFLRFTGPVLLAQAVLALRDRVAR